MHVQIDWEILFTIWSVIRVKYTKPFVGITVLDLATTQFNSIQLKKFKIPKNKKIISKWKYIYIYIPSVSEKMPENKEIKNIVKIHNQYIIENFL